MKKKINIQFIFIAILAIIVTVFSVSVVYYELFKEEIMDDLKTYAHVLIYSDSYLNAEKNIKGFQDDEVRVTVIKPDGSVDFDTNADIGGLDNHSHRPEVVKALKKGEGESIRKSKTMDMNAFYYAVRLDNGSVLRVAKEAGSIYSIYQNAFPIIGVILIVLFILCLILSHFLTKSLVHPIEQIAKDIDNCSNVGVYKELKPFLNTIKNQHEDIMKNVEIRQEFTANVSHELKTPLTSISGYAELIENGMATNADVQRFATEIHRSSNRLLSLINDIIRLSELDIVDQNIVCEEINLYSISFNCVDMLRVTAERHKVKIDIEGHDVFINANAGMIEELVYNLCDNAIRYNNKNGKVLVKVYRDDENSYLEVKDTGIGISKENQERIFERFYRVDKSRSKSTGGTGLGLAIVKHIVAQHTEASIVVDSEIGKGTSIKVVFPHIKEN